ncbi:hypothetical protein CEXT_176551 [Caerostris extrusa]|uniref:Uncharacterized protein n=1 Tax=Caerostris extrusa TaxID=172846 RepID=A0AAV4NGY7_CAEEX|nr:hypothetical protein CEXT_176551 [Caerostris extrusa]
MGKWKLNESSSASGCQGNELLRHPATKITAASCFAERSFLHFLRFVTQDLENKEFWRDRYPDFTGYIRHGLLPNIFQEPFMIREPDYSLVVMKIDYSIRKVKIDFENSACKK